MKKLRDIRVMGTKEKSHGKNIKSWCFWRTKGGVKMKKDEVSWQKA